MATQEPIDPTVENLIEQVNVARAGIDERQGIEARQFEADIVASNKEAARIAAEAAAKEVSDEAARNPGFS